MKITVYPILPFFFILVVAVANQFDVDSASTTSQSQSATSNDKNENESTSFVPPNFVIVLTDDLDSTLGGSNASTLAKTRYLLGGQPQQQGSNSHSTTTTGGGKTFDDWFVQTPVCCVSRAELLTGRLFHNLKVSDSSQRGCMHVDVNETDPNHSFWKDYYFSNFFGTSSQANLNYSVGLFGKHLNPPHNPTTFLPNGVDEMLINGGGNYLNPSFTHGTRTRPNSTSKHAAFRDDPYIEEVHFNNCTESTGMPCYSTSVIGNASLAWIRKQVHQQQSQSQSSSSSHNPFLAFISLKAPHIQDGPGFPMAIPAPWYQNTTLMEKNAPRTPNYNHSASDHHWVVRTQPPLTTLQAQKVDELYVSRLKTLMSVDDLVHNLVHELDRLQVLENTYVIFTSDHGYRLGQFQIPQCKLHPYENDVRVPMMIRGPGIGSQPLLANQKQNQKRSKSSHTAQFYEPRALFSHVHLMPTLLGLATGVHYSQDIVPDTMDGTNLAGWLLDQGCDPDPTPKGSPSTTTTAIDSSVSLLIEYTSLGHLVRYQHLVDTFNHSFVALRIMPAYDLDTELSSNATANTTSNLLIRHISNLKYIEFRDSRVDWNNTGPPLERELYDLDRDPYELDNLLAPQSQTKVSPSLLLALETKMDRLIACSGDDCRREHSTGLDDSIDVAIATRLKEKML